MALEPVVAVCTNRSPSAVADALAALRRQVPDDRIVLVCSGLSPAQVAEHEAAQPGIAVLREPQEGLSIARNGALRWAAGRAARAIAYVDDDAIIGSGWWAALSGRWGKADRQLGVIGGPIRPRFAAPAPDWISAPILPALTLLDLGPAERELDPGTTTVFGANISFGVAALGEIGGFDPSYGHSGKRVFFSEEDQAQRALAQRGYRILYAPELEVEHVIGAERLTRGSFVRRRYAYGRALGKRGGRSPGLAARQLVTSGLGAPLAWLQRDKQLVMERLVRAAENAGVLAGRARPG